jgi:hypothetical protein
MGKAQSLLRQPRVQEAVGRMNSLAAQLHLREALGKVPPLVRQWRLPERLGGLYNDSLRPHLAKLGRHKRWGAIVDLDRLVARGAELQRAPDGGDDER